MGTFRFVKYDDAVKSFDEPVPQVDAMKRGSLFSQRAFLLFAENMFVEKPLLGSLWLVVLAREALAVFPFDPKFGSRMTRIAV